MDWLGLFHLFKLFLRYCYDPDDPKADLFSHNYVPRPNDFSDLAEYFVRKVSFRDLIPVTHDDLTIYRACCGPSPEYASATERRRL